MQITLTDIVKQFDISCNNCSISEISDGNINDTYLVSTATAVESRKQYVLQRINHNVFPDPKLVAENIKTVISHIQKKLTNNDHLYSRERIEFPYFIQTIEGKNCFQDSGGNFWRMITCVENAKTFQRIESTHHAQETGFALGLFHFLMQDVDKEALSNTLKEFHVTPKYLSRFDSVLDQTCGTDRISQQATACFDFINSRRDLVSVLEDGKRENTLSMLPIHGDPKINNVLLDADTEEAICMIDLDTVNVGLVLYDIADCFRSSCNIAGEDAPNPDSVRFDLELMEAILQSYLSVTQNLMKEADFDHLFDATRIIAFELGLRFFTDYLEGDVYFKTRTEDHNLKRAVVQFKLCQDIEAKEADIKRIIDKLQPK